MVKLLPSEVATIYLFVYFWFTVIKIGRGIPRKLCFERVIFFSRLFSCNEEFEDQADSLERNVKGFL